MEIFLLGDKYFCQKAIGMWTVSHTTAQVSFLLQPSALDPSNRGIKNLAMGIDAVTYTYEKLVVLLDVGGRHGGQ